MRIRTVLDARPGASQSYLPATLLLAHSWAAHRVASPLEVVVVGKAPSALIGRLRELGVEMTEFPPHPLDCVARGGNKLLGLTASGDDSVLLVDNDVCFLDDIADLQGRKVRASVNDKNLISQAQWERITAVTGLGPFPMAWISPKGELNAKREGRTPEPHQFLYLNGGVVWVREPVAFAETWAAHIAAIAHAFDGHPLSTYWVQGSDQVGLVTAAAEHGGFDLLPSTYNCLPVCIQLGLEPKILHFTKLGRTNRAPFFQALAAWHDRVLARITRDIECSTLPAAEAEGHRLLDQAVGLRNQTLKLAAEAGLDEFDF